MKKQILSIAAIALVAGSITFVGCKKDDTTAPSITLSGGDVTIYVGDTYTDPGFSASDDVDGDITANVTSSTNLPLSSSGAATSAGSYTVTYNVSDKAGNAATAAVRNVYVKVKNSTLNGAWSASESCSLTGSTTYTVTIIPDAAAADMVTIDIENFGGYGTTATVVGTLSGSSNQTLTVPSQVVGGATFIANGTINSAVNNISLTYTASAGGQSNSCTSTYTR